MQFYKHLVTHYSALTCVQPAGEYPFSTMPLFAAGVDLRRKSDYPDVVSPTVLRARGYRFYFFSREEVRPHVHVQHAEGEAKFWLEPAAELAVNAGLSARRLREAGRLVEVHLDEIREAWTTHFGS